MAHLYCVVDVVEPDTTSIKATVKYATDTSCKMKMEYDLNQINYAKIKEDISLWQKM